MSKLATLHVTAINGVPADDDKIFNLENIFYPIREEDGVTTIVSREIKGSNVTYVKYALSDTLQDLADNFNDISTAGAENVGLIGLTVVFAGNTEVDSETYWFPFANIAAPIYAVSRYVTKNGTVVEGDFSVIPMLDQNGVSIKLFYVTETLSEITTLANEDQNGIDRAIRLYTYWRDYKTNNALNSDITYPAWVVYPVYLIEFPIEQTDAYAKPGEPNGIVLNIYERHLARRIPHKVASSLENIFTIITEPALSSYYDVVNGSAPQLFYP